MESTLTKKCSKCQEVKSSSEFHFRKERNNYFTICKICRKEQKRRYKLQNPLHYQKYNHQYKITHRIQRNKDLQKQRQNNPQFRKIESLRSRVNIALKHNLKAAHTIELLGQSIPEYQYYLEAQFDSNMTHANYGKLWHIDHIIPLSFFNLSDPIEQRQAFHYTNTRPLLIKDNIQKGAKILDMNYNNSTPFI